MACIWPSYQAGKHQSQQHDPPRSMSNITPALSEIAALDYHLFTANPDYSEQRKILPPLSTPSHSIFFFAMSKSDATKNKKKAHALFNSFTKQLQQTTFVAFSDRFVTSAYISCVYTIPDIKSEETWFLTPGSNIQTTELHGIL